MKKRETEEIRVNTVLDELLIKRGIVIKESSKKLYDRFYIGKETKIIESKDDIRAINITSRTGKEQLIVKPDGTCSVSVSLFGDF